MILDGSLAVKIASAQYPIDLFENINQWKNKTEQWVKSAASAGARYLLFPEYGSMELTSLLNEDQRKNLKLQSLNLKSFLPEFIDNFEKLAQKYECYIIAPSFPVWQSEQLTTNRVHVFSPSGNSGYQDKLFMTRFEEEDWGVQAGKSQIKIFKTADFKFSISTCFDVEFSFPALAAAHSGAEVLFVPSCTETLKGANRVHIGARARALENQMYVVVSQTVGEALWSPSVDINSGYAAFYSTPDVGFNDDGIITSGQLNAVTWIYAELRLSHLQKVRNSGAVFNYKKHQDFFKANKAHLQYEITEVSL